ncbi:MAG: glycine cleavage system aminomethyltransferase GcvT [Bacteroidia bacterium]|nr:glycine cleavage system aminomethyltransferase GcvT [Bacteroidia bacterium]MDW8134201.1 glycine cleavage system aminomethyltransferase GcvT [Bacteroidia bacterium]
MLKKSPLYALHQQIGAHFTAFGGWEMPLRYVGEIAEHQAVRQRVGLFDLSHMGEILVRGPEAFNFLQYMLSNDLRKVQVGRAQYTFLLNVSGGVIDDLIVYQLEPELFLLVVNAANTSKVVEWLQEHLPSEGVSLEDISEETVLLALSGPLSTEVLSSFVKEVRLGELPYYAFTRGKVGEIPDVLIATTGYTGEWTYELFVRLDWGEKLWQMLLEWGGGRAVQPAGLGARNTLRLEMGYLLCGVDMDETISPLEAGAAWAVKLDKGDFIGRSALQRQKAKGLERRLVGLLSESSRVIPRNGMPLLNEGGEVVGRITSGSLSPSLQRGVALGYLPPSYSYGDKVYISLRGQLVPLKITSTPFVTETSLSRRQKARL